MEAWLSRRPVLDDLFIQHLFLGSSVAEMRALSPPQYTAHFLVCILAVLVVCEVMQRMRGRLCRLRGARRGALSYHTKKKRLCKSGGLKHTPVYSKIDDPFSSPSAAPEKSPSSSPPNRLLIDTLPPFTKSGTVPKIVWKTGGGKPSDALLQIFNKILADNPEFTLCYMTNDGAAAFLRKYYHPSVLCAFESLKPGAYKGDLIRYCLIFAFGGIYSDLKQEFLQPLSDLYTSTDTLVLTQDLVHNDKEGVQISFMISQPRQGVFLESIRECIMNVNANFYGVGPLDITGPQMFHRVMMSMRQEYTYRFKQYNDNIITDLQDKPIIVCKTRELKTLFQSGAYNKDWTERTVFLKSCSGFFGQANSTLCKTD